MTRPSSARRAFAGLLALAAASPLMGGECGYTTAPVVQERAITPANFTPMDVTTSR